MMCDLTCSTQDVWNAAVWLWTLDIDRRCCRVAVDIEWFRLSWPSDLLSYQ